jgi:hypothetical protein
MLANKITNDSKTNWGALAGWASAIVVFMSIVGSLAINPLQVALNKAQQSIEEHTNMFAHPAIKEQVVALQNNYAETKEALKLQDDALQREMRDLISGVHKEMEAKIASLDKTLQMEMRLINEKISDRATRNKESISKLFDWQTDHDRRVVGLNAAQTERIKNLEQAVFKKEIKIIGSSNVPRTNKQSP